jgi:hypothetical protein
LSDFAPDLKRILSEAGCYFIRHGKGDHDIWFSHLGQALYGRSQNQVPPHRERHAEAGRSTEGVLICSQMKGVGKYSLTA